MHSNTARSPVSLLTASIREECPYLEQWARASSAACWRVIPAIGMAPPISLPATLGPAQPDSTNITAKVSNNVAIRRFMVALLTLRRLFWGGTQCREDREG